MQGKYFVFLCSKYLNQFNKMTRKKKEPEDYYVAEYKHYPPTEDQVVDPNTGEITIRMTEEKITRTVEVTPDYVDIKLPKRGRFNNGNFITLFQKALANIAMFGDLTKGEMKLLMYLIGTCGNQNSVCVDLSKLASDLNTSKGGVATCLKGLVERNIVIRKDGYRYGKTPLPFELHLNFDQINYSLAYNGKTKNFKHTQHTHPCLMMADGETPLIENNQKEIKNTKSRSEVENIEKYGKPYPTLGDVCDAETIAP